MGNQKQIHNADFLMLKQEIKKRLEQLTIDLQGFSINGYFKQTVQKFRPCIEPNEALGESQLPFFSEKPESHSRSKDQCVLCMLSFTIQLYWKFCNNQDMKKGDDVTVGLDLLEGYAKYSSKNWKICGQKYPDGYHLEGV